MRINDYVQIGSYTFGINPYFGYILGFRPENSHLWVWVREEDGKVQLIDADELTVTDRHARPSDEVLRKIHKKYDVPYDQLIV